MSRAVSFRFLCGCLTQNLSEALRDELRHIALSGSVRWVTFVELASNCLVAPALLAAARENGLDDSLPMDVVAYLEGMATLNRQRNELIRTQAVELASILNDQNVAPVLLKGGAHLFSGLYADPGHRVMIDLDILIPVDRLFDCASALRRHGYEVLWDNGYPAHHHYPPLGRPGGIVSVELHVEALDYPYERLLGPAEIFKTALTLNCGGASLAVPSPQARTVHAIAHAQLSNHDYVYGSLALRELVDFAHLCRIYKNDIDWADIRRRFAECRAVTALGYHALAAKTLLGVPVDPEVRTSATARVLYRRAAWQVSAPGLLDLGIRLLRPWLLLRRGLSRATLRKRLLQSLCDLTWYRRQWRMLRGQSLQ
jgi:hypothetical protein